MLQTPISRIPRISRTPSAFLPLALTVALTALTGSLAVSLSGCATAPAVAERLETAPVGTVSTYHRRSSGSFGTVDGPVVWRAGTAEWQGRTVVASVSPQAGTQFYETGSHAMVAVLNPAGQPTQSYDPPIGYRWPLQVGKEWTSQHNVTLYPSMRVVPLEVRWKVEALEEVTVPAGTFKTFRIQTHSSLSESETVWTAPAQGLGVVKRHVVRTAQHPQGAGELHGELQSRVLPQ